MFYLVSEFLFALAVSAFITNLVILIKLKFSDQSLTHLSLLPYMISLSFFTIMLIEFGWQCYLKNVIFEENFTEYWKALVDPSSVYNDVLTGFEIIKIDLLFVFIVARTHE